MVLVGENNVGKSNVLEALKIFNDADVKLCSENDCFKAHEKDSLLSLEEETILDHKTIGFSCVDLKIQTKEVSEGLKELSKTLIVYPFSAFIGEFIKLVMSYGILDSFLKFYKEKLKLSAFATRQADNLLFKKLIKHLSGNNQLVKNFCQCVKEIIKHNTPNKKYNSDEFFVMGQHKQNQLAKIYSHFKKLSEGKIKPQNEYILKKLKSLDEIFKTTDFNTKFAPKTEVKDIIKEIDEKYHINENFKQQFRTFRSNIISLKKRIKNSLKDLEKTREDFELKKSD
ncbi:ATP-binding protein [Helicobacter pylori]|nr:ATP-binding protein [Helicobacter pylori]